MPSSSRPPLPPSKGNGGSSGGSGGGGGPRKSSTNNPSSRGDNHHGFAVTSSNLRPATHAEVGYPLLCYLNRKDCWADLFPKFSVGEDLQSANVDGLLNEVYGNWVRAGQKATKAAEEAATAKAADEAKAEEKKEKNQVGEKDLTKALVDKMQEALRSINKALEVLPEVHVTLTNPTMTGKVDILVQDRDKSPVLMIEAGLLNDDWWKKLDQGLMYVPGLEKFTKPFLFVVLTMDVKRDDPDSIQGGRMGAFLITPRSEGDNPRLLAKFRMTLLWRDETTDLKQFSEHFGRILRAACLLPKWNVATSTYHYLGPSCCRIGKNEEDWKVLRVYDNRLMHTDRRPDLYLDEDLGEGGRIVCQISDTARPEDALRFGARIEVDSSSTSSGGTTTTSSKEISSSSRDWLWANRGQFVAIVVPYRHGVHYATNIKDFKPILKHLRKLHEHGFVHGDVRGFNMAMNSENKGHLIDLDYGGKVECKFGNPPRYPEGYNYSLADCDRRKRPDRSPITMEDDLRAMTNFMCRLYVPDDFQGSADSYFSLTRKQNDLVKRVAKLEEGSVEAVLRFYESLLQFADEAGWSVMPATEALLEALESFGYDMEKRADRADRAGKRRVGTDPATGSPSKLQMG